MSITLHEKVVQMKGNLASNMDGERVMMSIESGKYYNLGRIGGRIWDLIEMPVVVEQLVTALMEEYEVDRSECEKQVVSFLEHLAKEQLIQIEQPGVHS